MCVLSLSTTAVRVQLASGVVGAGQRARHIFRREGPHHPINQATAQWDSFLSHFLTSCLAMKEVSCVETVSEAVTLA